MQPFHLRRRLIALTISVLVMLVLFFFAVRRSSDSRLPATPTEPLQTAAALSTASTPIAQSDTSPPAIPSPATLPLPEPSPTPSVTPTSTKVIDSEATAQIGMVKATQRARAMSDIVRILYDDGAVTKTEGYYNQLNDESISFNKPGYYNITFSDFQALNFVMRANVLWDNAGEEISFPTAGCGFVFGYQEMNDQNRVILTLDGNVRIQNIVGSITTQSTPEYYGELETPAGHANLILVVDQGWMSVYVNNTLVTRLYNEGMTIGWVGYLVEAGSAFDYGTRCDYKDIELWQVE